MHTIPIDSQLTEMLLSYIITTFDIYSIVYMGDDTWEALFPGQFTVSIPFDSFNTRVRLTLVCYICYL